MNIADVKTGMRVCVNTTPTATIYTVTGKTGFKVHLQEGRYGRWTIDCSALRKAPKQKVTK